MIAGAGALLLIAFMFLGWYRVRLWTSGGFVNPGLEYDAWEAFSLIDVYLLLTSLLAVGLVVAQASQRSPAVPVSLSLLTTVIGAIGVLLILFRILDAPDLLPSSAAIPSAAGSASGRHVDRSVETGAFLGLVAAIGITYGGYRSLREEGLAARDVRTEIETVMIGDRKSPSAGPSAG